MNNKLQECIFPEPMTCSQAEIAVLSHMEKTISLEDAHKLVQHMQECESCREYYLAFDEIMEYAASAETDWQEAPAGFTAAIMAEVNNMPVYVKHEQPIAAEIRSRGLATLHILWGISAILMGVVLFFAFNPDHFTNLTNTYPIFDRIATFISGMGASFSQMLDSMQSTHTIESSLGIAALLFTLLLGSLLVILHKDQEHSS